jgi:Ca2+-binding EF-hand superfamily protein
MILQSTSAVPAVVPSITLQITKHDAELFLDASKSLLSMLKDVQSKQPEDSHNEGNDKLHCEKPSKPLHEMMYDVAMDSSHPVVIGFLSRVSSLLTPKGVETVDAIHKLHEIQASLLLFHDCDKTTKLRNLLSIFASNEMQSTHLTYAEEEKKDDNPKEEKISNEISGLSQKATVSLFRTILTAISCCVHRPDHNEDKNTCNSSAEKSALKVRKFDGESAERPLKRTKLEPSDNASPNGENGKVDDEFGEANQCPSWDSLASLRDEDEVSSPVSKGLSDLQHEILGIAEYAGQDLFAFIEKRRQQQFEKDSVDERTEHTVVDLASFGDWYNENGSTVVPWLELLQLSKWKPVAKKKELVPVKSEDPDSETKIVASIVASSSKTIQEKSSVASQNEAISTESEKSKTLVSFDFTGSGSPTPLLINISEDNLLALQALIYQTQLIRCNASDICRTMLRAGNERTVDGKKILLLGKNDFTKAVRQIIPTVTYDQLSLAERESFDESLTDFFFCFEENKDSLQPDEVDLREFTVGFCLLCAGNKSSKLLKGFDLIDSESNGYLREAQLSRYLQSYLTMLVALSLIVPSPKKQTRRPLSRERRKELREAVESGANWTLSHFLKSVDDTRNEYTFETFARWYSDGGYAVAPWLELLDLKKVMSLIGEPHIHLHLPPLASLDKDYSTTNVFARKPRDRVSSLRRHHSSRRGPAPEILFTFPLGNRRSLVVLKEDALYVKEVVEKLGLLSMNPDYLWSALLKSAEKRHKSSSREHIDMSFFVECMKDVCSKQKRKMSANTASYSIEEILSNFYQCFDIDQCDSVSLDELMGGLTLLCGGKKSTKLAFAFNIFDTRPGLKSDRVGHSLSGQDLFVFLRSVLIVTFSTCRQSLDMSDKAVSLCITDTANMICNDVMRHQWETKQMDRLDFDEFGQWYNEGGFERAPWLELLDLNKWVLLQNIPPCTDVPVKNASHKKSTASKLRIEVCDTGNVPLLQTLSPTSPESVLAPPPNDDVLDNSFLDEIDSVSSFTDRFACTK